MSQAISYNGNSLQTTNILTQDLVHSGAATKVASVIALAHANKNKLPYVQYPSRTVTVSGRIIGSSIADCDAQIDTFMSYLTVQDANLDIGYNGTTRRYIGTPTSIAITRPGGLFYAHFDITFTCQPFGQNTTNTTALSASGRTLSSYNDTYTFLGTAPYQLPIITATFTALTGGTSKNVIVGNNSTGQSITVTRTWAVNDVLVIDSTLSSVTVNGTAVDFTGAFPQFPPGSQTIGYVDNLTSRTLTYSIAYPVMYI